MLRRSEDDGKEETTIEGFGEGLARAGDAKQGVAMKNELIGYKQSVGSSAGISSKKQLVLKRGRAGHNGRAL
jgi:hypothetical protein